MPVLISAAVILLVCCLEAVGRFHPRLSFFERLEWITYDQRVRLAARSSDSAVTNLGFVAISDDSIQAALDAYGFGLYWPRQMYGRLVSELSAQGALAVGLDVIFAERRPDHPSFDQGMGSDEFFAAEIRKAGNTVLAADRGLPPETLFRTNSSAVADISAFRDADGVLRRAKAFEDIRIWHPLIRGAERRWGWELRQAVAEKDRIIFPIAGGGRAELPINEAGQFNQAELYEELEREKPPTNVPIWSVAFTRIRCWQMGIELAARALGLDLNTARVEPDQGRIVLVGKLGETRTIPVDSSGRFLIDWSLDIQNPSLLKENIESLLFQNEHRRAGDISGLTNRWRNRLVVVGSTATGNDLTDLGTTPLEKETFLVSQHWNVAASLIRGRFVQRTGLMVDLGVILFAGILSGILTSKLRVLAGSVCVLAVTGLYVVGAFWLFVQWRWWIPVVLPAGGAMLVLHASLVANRAIQEQQERRRVKGVFDRLVSPKVVHELLKAPRLTLGGERLEITVMFADIRGFTSMTDDSQHRAQEYVQSRNMSPDQARQHFDQEASDSLRTVNTYLSLIADEVKRFDGTLDKYIGDCVMAFWGAPTPEKRHALTCVRAARAAQDAIHKLNHERIIENKRRTAENVRRVAQGEEALPMLALLSVGIGINSGMATVGLVGSEAHILNYTVFGREVNVASRLQQNAGPGRIVISESTFLALQRDDPSLAGSCREMPIALLKGIQGPVREYEVPVEVAPTARV